MNFEFEGISRLNWWITRFVRRQIEEKSPIDGSELEADGMTKY